MLVFENLEARLLADGRSVPSTGFTSQGTQPEPPLHNALPSSQMQALSLLSMKRMEGLLYSKYTKSFRRLPTSRDLCCQIAYIR